MIVAITGGTGFIGKKLALHHLAQGDEVRVLSRRSSDDSWLPSTIKWYRGDLVSKMDLLSFVDGVDVLYHCAGEILDETRMEAVHVVGTKNLIEAAAGKIKRWVQLSSTGVYGQPRAGAVTEQSPLQPVGVYEITKKFSDDLVEIAGRNGAFEWTILRPSIVFGEDMPNQSLFQLIRAIDRGQFFFIGRRGASANYIHVDNVIHALFICATLRPATGKVFNLSDYATLESFVEIIAKGLNRSIPSMRIPEWVARIISKTGLVLTKRFPLTGSRINALTNRTIYSINYIEKELNYRHIITMEAAVTRLVHAWKTKNR